MWDRASSVVPAYVLLVVCFEPQWTLWDGPQGSCICKLSELDHRSAVPWNIHPENVQAGRHAS